ncbi:MAG: type I DNA topoisomerase [Acutalibacteraceae bacterium]|nr:type I DNA topoisomerase [Acutalibacteraceae bacterium]
MHNLVIIESPGKAKTIKKYLGEDYEVVASMGHLRDLPKSKLGIDIEHDYKPMYVDIDNKTELIEKLRKLSKDSDNVYLATDPDREGEAISWHLAQLLGLDMNDDNRVTFNELTKTGIEEGMKNPRAIDIDLVDAQQTRRVLDRLVGYKISPFLWKKVKRGLSAGRVQSVAVKLIVDREREIRNFVPEEYWTIEAKLSKKGLAKTFVAKLYGTGDEKIEIKNEADAQKVYDEVKNENFVISNIKKGVRNKKPSPPFTTSTLQQEAVRKLGFASKKTMRIAQALYEGVEIKGLGSTGLITYMRTDSLRISEEARKAGEDYIKSTYGENYIPAKRTVYKAKAGAQDAHEAIRPTSPTLTPEKIKSDLTLEQYKLYKLIWDRFMSSLMVPCVQDTVNIDINAGKYLFKTSGYTVRFDGFTVLYEETVENSDEDEQKTLPKLDNGEVLNLKDLSSLQHFTSPPPRYDEARLVKTLEEKKIGRPSTYVPILSTVQQRDYVEVVKKYFVPTQLGEIVTEIMEKQFAYIVDAKFTAKMESELDNIESGKLDWIKVIDDFYKKFEVTLEKAEEDMNGKRVKLPVEESDVVCELCGKKMIVKSGRFGKFLACPGYPECKNTKPIVTEMSGSCPKCGSKILLKKSSKGHKYYGCEKGKECGFMTWDEPTKDLCPNCGKTLFKGRGVIHCLNEGCEYEIKKEKRTKKSDEN